ncbi:trigger factor [Candidatus Saccharibacteria bacterium CG11_big_fil_rev_8_21_14_0_20_41_19]|nr:trigger factor [Candidatus Saccharibacteria bacterium]OIP86226.1 MAG: trigger factor [Candidatus Saccharibacteria bacterium CG2_30_41_52]PIQ71038.1 MAG: trigger factor [Candidatus Saccharibacteria bacterium CG11_big_fil_rev_8_21_14_0_20_41_19]PIZ59427.1 MAG: trigger factor [Candidatus Saccharibacteria bacterium CG_4_10_14_0_2_um_filter_41_11]PJC29380.1 MAG: trigger factor [Candidatus Saccharibacteria bacterium CG_4_9_14_0_2_um_filter_41_9]PJE66059.1 MAG: trigger factor [Candidatus Saccharib
MKTSVKNISDTKVVLTITVDAAELAVAEQVALTKLARDVKVPGFRKGKTPISVAAKNVDPGTLQENALNNAISKAVAEAFVNSEIQALDRPAVEVKKFVPGEMLEFTAEAEILPKIKLGNYKKLKAKAAKVVVEKSEIDEIVERMRKGFAEKKAVKRAAIDGDETIIDFVGKKGGVAFDGGTGTDYALTLGSNQFVPGFESGVVGHKAGETFDIELTFPADYGSADLKGAKVTFTTTIKTVKEVVLPEITDAFAKKAGPFNTVAELLADIKRELTTQKEKEAGEKLKDALVTELVAASHVPVPDILVEDQAKSIEQDFSNNLMYQGVTIEQYLENKGFESKEKWLETEVHDVAVKRVQAGLALAELSKIEKIEATSAELEAHVDTYRQQYAKNPEALKQFDQPEVRRDIANRLITEKTVDRLVELNKK